MEFPVTTLTGTKEADRGLFAWVLAQAMGRQFQNKTPMRSRKPWKFMTPMERYKARQRKLRRQAMARRTGAKKPGPAHD
jgi:hypothetical protein